MISTSPPARHALPYLVIIVLTSIAVGLPYWLPGWELPKTEDFEYTVLPTMLFVRQVFDGTVTWWNPDIGLGSPWPIPTGMTHSPFSILFLWSPPLNVVGFVAAGHTLVMGLSGFALFRRFGLNGAVLAAALVTLQLSTALEYLYWSDAIAVYITWTMVAPMFLMVDIILKDSRRRAFVAALVFGGIVGYLCLNGHMGVLSAYLIGLAVFVLAQPRRMLRRVPFFLLAVLAAVLIGAEKLVYLLSETRLFSPDTYRDQQGLSGGVWGLIYNALLRPLFLPDPRHLLDPQRWLSAFSAANSFSRTLGFGVVFTVLAVISIAVPRLIAPFRDHRPLALTFVAAVILMLWPVQWLPHAISATWPLRDVVLVAGVILAGLTLGALRPAIVQRWGHDAPARVVGLQIAVVAISALALIAGPNWLQTRGKATTAFYNALAEDGAATPYLATLSDAVARDGEPGGRFIVTGEVERMMDIEMLLDIGAINNIGPMHGLSEVSFIAKGVSYDAIRPAQLVPYGTIAGDRMQLWTLDAEQHTDWTRDDQALLTFLGIEAVVTAADEPVSAPGLTLVSQLEGPSGIGAAVYANSELLPLAFEVPSALLDGHTPPRGGCTASLTCLDLTSIVSEADASRISARTIGDKLSIDIEAPSLATSVLVTQMWRPDWRLDAEAAASGVVLSSWNGVIRLDIPSGVQSVSATYEPGYLLLARNVTLAGSMLWLVLLTVAGFLGLTSPGRRQPSTQAV